MKILTLTLPLLLCACAMDSYRPEVVPPEGANYESDVKECIQYSKDIRSRPNPLTSLVTVSTGAVGLLALESAKHPKDPVFMDGYELTDQCLESKGYALK